MNEQDELAVIREGRRVEHRRFAQHMATRHEWLNMVYGKNYSCDPIREELRARA